MSGVLRVGTRRSALATTQAAQVAAAVTAATGRETVLVPVVTAGDRTERSIAALGGTGVFVAALRQALQSGEVDVAVHSLKDLPTAAEPGVVLAAVPPREDPRDALVARDGLGLFALPPGARVGTGSPRRAAQLRALQRDLEVVPVRGNVDTRLRLVADGGLDAVVVALAGLLRLGRDAEASELLDPHLVLPAPGQGALAVECREGDGHTAAAVATLEDPAARVSVTAERSLLAALQAGCSAPVGALASVGTGRSSVGRPTEPAPATTAHPAPPATRPPAGPATDHHGAAEVYLLGAVVALDGSDAVRLSATGPAFDAAGLGRRLADDLLQAGAADLMGVSA